MTNRNATIDIARGIGIILVAFGHNWIVLHDRGEIFRIVFSFHVPLFFFLSGLFLKDSQPVNQFIRSRINVLIKPYLVVLMFVGIVKIFKTIIIGPEETSLLTYFMGVFYASGPTITIAWIPLWFLPHLFLDSVISLFILTATKSLKHREIWLYFISSVLLSIGIYTINILLPTFTDLNRWSGLPLSFDLMPIGTAFILFGFVLSKQVKSMEFNLAWLLVAMIGFTLLHYYFNETMDLNLRLYGNPLISSLQAITGIYTILSISSFLQKFSRLRQLLTYISYGSLFILMFHAVIQGLTFLGLSRISHNNYLNAIASLVVAILLPLVLLKITQRHRFLAILLLPSKAYQNSQNRS